MNFIFKRNFIFLLLIFSQYPLLAQEFKTFEPLSNPKEVKARLLQGDIVIDGKLEEADWKAFKPASDFFQIQPNQGDPLFFDTKVRVLYDHKNLYFGIFSPDSLGKRAIRVPDMRRDFDFWTNDLVSISMDPFQDKRNAISFMTNPHGAQRDLLVFDDYLFDREWDGLWKVRTNRTDSGWTAEIAIPWKTLRYPRDSTTWGINFLTINRRLNQSSSWNPYPQATNHQRMEYAGRLTDLKPPLPSLNFRVQPYALTTLDRNSINDNSEAINIVPKAGGEIKWAINPYTVLDLTANTDFAQADVDRQVNNLTRFSVFFPERRQFFLENANLFSMGQPGAIEPFFSRRIGISEDGTPLPVDGGARLISRSPKRGYGGLLMRQREVGDNPAAYFGVGRYSKNFGKQNRIGGMVTGRYDEATETAPSSTNMTYSMDAFFRPIQPLSWSLMVSGSTTSESNESGFAATSQLIYNSNKLYLFYYQSLLTRDYDPKAGFIYSSNILNTSVGGYRILRPKWRPKSIRQIDPGAYVNVYHRLSDGAFQQAEVEFFPFYIVFVKGALFYTYIIPTWQQLDHPFSPLGIHISPGRYQYNRYRIYYGNDQSRKLSFRLKYEDGGYYHVRLQNLFGLIRYAPIPHVSMSFSYEHNIFHGLQQETAPKKTHLLTPELRLALNPRIQLIGFYQRNTAIDRDIWNVRFSWEFQPLSFIYLVYNSNTFDSVDRIHNEQVIGKITFLKQF